MTFEIKKNVKEIVNKEFEMTDSHRGIIESEILIAKASCDEILSHLTEFVSYLVANHKELKGISGREVKDVINSLKKLEVKEIEGEYDDY